MSKPNEKSMNNTKKRGELVYISLPRRGGIQDKLNERYGKLRLHRKQAEEKVKQTK